MPNFNDYIDECVRPNIRKLEKPIVFIHVQKTAGTAFTHYLSSHMPSKLIADPSMGKFKKAFFLDGAKKLFWGHLSYGEFSKEKIDAYLITFLRDPFERVISQYYSLHNPNSLTDHWLSILPKAAIDAVKCIQEMSLNEFVLSENAYIICHINNLQVKSLCDNGVSKNVDSLNSAMNILENKFYFFGIVEFFNESLSIFRQMFSDTKNYDVLPEKENRSIVKNQTLSEKSVSRMKDLNQYDLKLYEFSKMLFMERRSNFNIAPFSLI